MELSELRKEIDTVDDQLLSLFLRRMQLSEEVAACKRQQGLPLLHPGREQEILDWAAKRSGPTLAPYAEALYREIFSLSRQRQAQVNGWAEETKGGQVHGR